MRCHGWPPALVLSLSVKNRGSMPMHSTQTPLTRPGTLAEALRRARAETGIDDEGFRTALAEFLDTFYLDPDRYSQRARVDEDPGLVGVAKVDAFIGAVGEHLCRRWNLGDPPEWTDASERFLDRPFFMGLERMKAFMIIESPSAFRRRMIFTEAEPLRRARMPRDGRWWAYEEMRSGLKPEPGEIVEMPRASI